MIFQTFTGNTNSNVGVTNMFEHSVYARALRWIPRVAVEHPSGRIEILGC